MDRQEDDVKTGKTRLAQVFLPLFVTLILMSACSQAIQHNGYTIVTLQPAHSHEDCTMVADQESLSYLFIANAPVDFNIYDQTDHTFYPRQIKVTSVKGSTPAGISALYCLKWTNNGKKPASVKYMLRKNRVTFF